jgi:acyl carrier protein
VTGGTYCGEPTGEKQGVIPMSTAGATRDDALYDSVRTTVEQAIIDVVGQEFYEECEVGLESTFAEDIELESIEVMEIAEKLIDTYGEKVDFVAWFADMQLEDLVEITVGSVVDFIVTSLRRAEVGDPATQGA